MTEHDEAGLPAGSTASTPIVHPSVNPDKPTIVIERVRLAWWLEQVEAAIDNPDIAVDVLVDLAASIEDLWLSPEVAS